MTIFRMTAIMLFAFAFAVFSLASCSGGGGGVVDDAGQNAGGGGTGAGGIPVFSYKYGFPDFGSARSAVEMPDKSFVFAGLKQPQDQPVQLYVVKTDATGQVISEHTYTTLDGSSGGSLGSCIRQTDDGGFIIPGTTVYGGQPHFYLLKTDENGGKRWSKPFPGAVGGTMGFESVWQTKTGGAADGYVAVGSVPGQMADIYLLKTDLTGSVLWDAKLGGSLNDFGSAVMQTADGGLAVAGQVDRPRLEDIGVAVLYKTDAQGAEIWSRKFGPGGFASLVQTTDEGFVLVGSTPDSGGKSDVLVVLTDASGNEMRRRTFGGSDNDTGNAVALTQDGGFIIAGSTSSYSPGTAPLNADIFLIKLKPNLDTEWQVVKGRINSGDGGSGVIATSDGGYLVSGSLGGSAMLTKFDKNGDTITFSEEDFVYRPSDNSAGVITMANARDAAGAAATSFDITSKVGSFAVDLLVDVLKGGTPASFCTGGGSYAATLSTPGTVISSTIFNVTFTDCAISQGSVTINGSFVMSVGSVSGDITTPTYQVGCSIDLPALSFTDDVGMKSASGGLEFTRNATAAGRSDLATSITGTQFSLSWAGTDIRIQAFSVQTGQTASQSTLGPASATLVRSGIGTLQASIDQANTLQGPSLLDPSTGAMTTTGSDGTTVRATLSAGGNVRLDIDADGNGTYEGSQSALWNDMLY